MPETAAFVDGKPSGTVGAAIFPGFGGEAGTCTRRLSSPPKNLCSISTEILYSHFSARSALSPDTERLPPALLSAQLSWQRSSSRRQSRQRFLKRVGDSSV